MSSSADRFGRCGKPLEFGLGGTAPEWCPDIPPSFRFPISSQSPPAADNRHRSGKIFMGTCRSVKASRFSRMGFRNVGVVVVPARPAGSRRRLGQGDIHQRPVVEGGGVIYGFTTPKAQHRVGVSMCSSWHSPFYAEASTHRCGAGRTQNPPARPETL